MATASAYDGFLSYSHDDHAGFARLLQRRVQRMGARFPWQRRIRVFRDETNLAARPDLWGSIADAIDRSGALILLASPASAASEWVEREVGHFLATHDLLQLVVVLIDGDTPWTEPAEPNGVSTQSALSPRLLKIFEERNWEPLVVDFRTAGSARNPTRTPEFLSRIATISAAVQGRDKDEIYGEHIRAQRYAMTAMGATLLLILGLAVAAFVQRDAAVAARDLAERRLDQALSVANHINFVIEEDLRRVGGAADIRTDLLDASAELLNSLLGEASQSQEALFQSAVSHTYRADLAVEHEDLDAAERELESAAGLTARLVDQDASNTEWQQTLSVVLNRLGELHIAHGEPQLAFERFRRAYEIRQQLAEMEPDNGRRTLDVAVSVILLADMLVEIGRNDEAIEEYRKAEEALTLLAQENPDVLDVTMNTVSVGDKIGDLHAAAGRYELAAQQYVKGETLLREALLENSGHTGLRRSLTGSLQRLGDVDLAMRSREAAVEHYREAETLAEALVTDEPDNTDWLMIEAVAVRKVGDAEAAADRAEVAQRTYERSVALARRLVALDSENAAFQDTLAGSLERLAQFRSRAGASAAARPLFAEIVEIRAELADRSATVARLSDLGAAYWNAGLALQSEDDAELAAQAYGEAVTAYEEALALDPAQEELAFQLADLNNELGNLAYEAGNEDDARTHYQRAADSVANVVDADRAARKRAWSFYRLGRIESDKEDAAVAAGTRGASVQPAIQAAAFYAQALNLAPEDEDYAEILLWSQRRVFALIADMPDETARLTLRALAAEAEGLEARAPGAAAEVHRIGATAALELLHEPDLALRFSDRAIEIAAAPSVGLLCEHAELSLATRSPYDEIVAQSKRCIENAKLLDDRVAGQLFMLAAAVLARDAGTAEQAGTTLIQSLDELGAPLDWSFDGLKNALEQHEQPAPDEFLKLLDALAVSDPARRNAAARTALTSVLVSSGTQ